ncbi:MAG TPA: hypothetical protein ENI52_01740 [Thermoplasmata archaeon]|nr:hypothetical protein [Thermoplasmata archaeon]
MKTGKYVGLAFLGGGFLILIVYGIYNLIKKISGIDPVIFIALIVIIFGIVLLLVSTAMERKSEELEKIRKEDLRP